MCTCWFKPKKRQPTEGAVSTFLQGPPEDISSDTLNFFWSYLPQTSHWPCSQLSTEFTKQLFIMSPSWCFVRYWKLSCGLVEPHRLRASLCRPAGVQLIPVRADDSFPQSKQCKLCVWGRTFVSSVHACACLFGLCHIRTHCLQASRNRGSPLEQKGPVKLIMRNNKHTTLHFVSWNLFG